MGGSKGTFMRRFPLDASPKSPPRGEVIGQCHTKTVEFRFSRCMRVYGVILYHVVTGMGFTIKAMLLHLP